ncbi:hypothetical protein [Streptomyces arboris]|uniref:Uncharacterized protein n=1 Tax=Streptomyces arboris TaxID=2600619 RepID=A0A5N5EAH3_9ACTN|nr:hypothetical protein [Streptomyces arboris]KAB2587489.1 hypothetical protein F5983_37730 [Streptomyces arboris]
MPPGATENGDLLVADLLHTGTLLLEGTADDVLAVGRAMALEAGTCGWTDHTEIMTVGLGTRLATVSPRRGMDRRSPRWPRSSTCAPAAVPSSSAPRWTR